MSTEPASILVATEGEVIVIEPARGAASRGRGLEGRHPTCLATDSGVDLRAWCGTKGGGVFRSDDAGRSWEAAGLEGLHVTALAFDPSNPGAVWVGTEPSALWRSGDGGGSWEEMHGLMDLPSSSEWSFPPKPETHHVRWIACHPHTAGRLWLAIEAGALVTTPDGGRSWEDRVPGGPWDTHELALHPARPEALRVAAGDGYFESDDGGRSWTAPRQGLEVGYLRSVAIDPGDPEVVVVSAASRPRSAYVAGRSDGRLYRREARGGADTVWKRVREGWPDPPATIAPLLLAGAASGELWAADERGLHRSEDGGRRWEKLVAFPETPHHLRGIARLSPLSPRALGV